MSLIYLSDNISNKGSQVSRAILSLSKQDWLPMLPLCSALSNVLGTI